MNGGGGVRPNRLWHWFAVAFLVATFLAEPRAFVAASWQVFRGAGALGGELLTGDPEPDVLNLHTNDQTDTNDGDVQADDDNSGATVPVPELEHEPSGSGDSFSSAPARESGTVPTVRLDSDGLRSVLDQGADVVVGLHDRVAEVQTAGGFNVEIGSGSGVSS